MPPPDDRPKKQRRLTPVPGVIDPADLDFEEVDEPSGAAEPNASAPRAAEPDAVAKPEGVPPSTSGDATADDAAGLDVASSDTPDDGRAHSIPEAKAVTKRRAHDLGLLLARYVRRHLPPRAPAAPHVVPEPPKLKGRLGQILPIMQMIPWLLGVVFAASFVWDFPGASVDLFGRVLPIEGLLRILSVSGLIGFATNWLAITMLFQPREKRPIVPQGLIPAQRERVIFRLAQAISQELINEEIIKQKIEESGAIRKYREQAVGVLKSVVEDPEFRGELKALTTVYVESVLGSEEMRDKLTKLAMEKIENYAGQGLGGFALKAYRAVNEDAFQRSIARAVREIPGALDPVLDRLDEMLDKVPEKVEARSEQIETFATKTVLGFVERLDVYSMIVENARGFDEAQLENLLKKTSNEQLNYIKYLGGILGVIGGFVIWEPIIALAVLTAFTLGLWGLDEALYRLRRSGDPA
jgi:uncharacterized membrane protein YheB (UPF0754 family)